MSDQAPPTFMHSPFEPFDPAVGRYSVLSMVGGLAKPIYHDGWKAESLASKTTCYLNATLNPTLTYKVTGPDALKLLSDVCINSMANFEIGSAKHAVMCNEQGNIMGDGVLLRLGEEEFVTYWLAPYLPYRLMAGGYDAQGEDLTGKVFLFQVAGPNALAVLEAATGESLSGIGFLHAGAARIAGADVRILRLGMAGTLAYEVHGRVEDAILVYEAIAAAGQPHGLARMGDGSYSLNHTEGGFPQYMIHFLYAYPQDPGFMAAMAAMMPGGAPAVTLAGSMANEGIESYWRTPADNGWARYARFDHDFTGREALEDDVQHPKRKVVSLAWSADDVVDVYRSQFEKGAEYQYMEFPNENITARNGITVVNDKVLKRGRLVGVSGGRMYSYWGREMISIASVDIAEAGLGNDLIVLWGDPGSRQKEVRATVVPYPYIQAGRNSTVDARALSATSRA
jgi:glycine cleavage system aminomethyltransferase T